MMTRTRTAPSGYEKVRVWFHLIRSFQFVASMAVGGIIINFAWYLTQAGRNIPWTFAILMTTTFITMIALAVTLTFHCLTGLSPRINLIANSVMLFGWALGFSMLAYWSRDTVWHACSVQKWRDESGLSVCRAYKALFSFGFIGLISTAAAFVLDLKIRRLAQRFGTHVRLDHDQKAGARSVLDLRSSPYGDQDHARSNLSLDNYNGRNSDAFEVPHAGFGAQASHHVPSSSISQLPPTKQGLLSVDDYARPASPTHDTSYQGGHHERVYGNGPRSPI